ncbi:MAG: beta-ketoacyl-[acyl-carrier-protein] synthase family protein [Bacteroidota bacterium]
MEKHRVVITGIGVVASNAIGVKNYEKALRKGKSGIKHWEELNKINLKCQIGGAPDLDSIDLGDHLPRLLAEKITNKGILYAMLSGVEAWKDAGLEPSTDTRDYQSGMIFGAGDLSFDSFINRDFPAYPIDNGDSRRLGSRTISECMNSGGAAYLNSILGLGNRVQSNSSACITGSEAVLMGYEHLVLGKAERMICGSTEGDGRYIWAAFDAMRVLCSNSNDNPQFGSRPMSDSSSGFVPAGGSGALVLETLESAKARGVKIYGEILGGHVNSGGQRSGGTMTAANPEAVVDCITRAMKSANLHPDEIDLINGHLTSTKGDPAEIRNWVKALGRSGKDFPLINTPKSMIGHAVAGAGSVELIASVLQLKKDFIHPNLNVENIHPEILSEIFGGCIPTSCLDQEVNTITKPKVSFDNCVYFLI